MLWVQIFSCYFLTGVIWAVQLLIYPNFKLLGREDFQKFHQFHMKRITWIVGPVMAAELVSGVWLFIANQNLIYSVNLLSIGFIWVLTATVNVPTHHRLHFENESTKNKLVQGNWPRTLIWTLRSGFWIWFLPLP